MVYDQEKGNVLRSLANARRLLESLVYSLDGDDLVILQVRYHYG